MDLNMNLDSALHIAENEIKKMSLIDEELPIDKFLKTSFKKNPFTNEKIFLRIMKT